MQRMPGAAELITDLDALNDQCQLERTMITDACITQKQYINQLANLNDTVDLLNRKKLSVLNELEKTDHTRQVSELLIDLQDKDAVLDRMRLGFDEFKAWTDRCEHKLRDCHTVNQRICVALADETFEEDEKCVKQLMDELGLNFDNSVITSPHYNDWKSDCEAKLNMTMDIESQFNDLLGRAKLLFPSLNYVPDTETNLYTFSCDISVDDFLNEASNNFVFWANSFWTVFSEVKNRAARTLPDCLLSYKQAYDTFLNVTSLQFENIGVRMRKEHSIMTTTVAIN